MDLKKIETIHKNAKTLLLKYPELRNPFLKKQRIWKYWQEFEGIGEFGITLRQFIRLTDAETISRAIRKVQEENPNLRPNLELEEKRSELVEEYREIYRRK